MVGGILGLVGVTITLFYSFFNDKRSKKFQLQLESDNENFQNTLAIQEHERRIWMKKYEVLVQLIGSRYDLSSTEFKRAFNSVPAVFFDSPDVIKSYKNFYSYKSNSSVDDGLANEKLVNVFVEMYRDLEIEENVDETDLEKIFDTH
ncbi:MULTISPECIES: hypothetical protein [Lactobacillaceae]|uniref:hypothetical protein n=1 Tax=Lactobacillaceae TaxID=33958 RepID=UPI000704956E|nr:MULTISPECIES: hypothetical protein [Lactobacillaceae]GEO62749.1 hypothetical protein LPA07_30700 [Lactiplantibacillus paraplantarum]